MQIAITGALSLPRREAINLIESKTNAKFSERVTYDTNYLVAARFDTTKARRAAKLGVSVISEQELMSYIEKGAFPKNKTPDRPKHSGFPEIRWHETFNPERNVFLEYKNAEGEMSQRYVILIKRGSTAAGVEYLLAFDIDCFKTFRMDRVIKIEYL